MRTQWIKMMLFSLALALPLSIWAQTGLNVAPYFDGRFNKSRQVVTLLVKGKSLKPYHLSFYRSMTFDNRMSVLDDIEKAVLSDARQAVDKETGYRGGHLLYGFYCLRPEREKEPLRYLIYRHGEENTFVVYMEGSATLDELKNMFKTK